MGTLCVCKSVESTTAYLMVATLIVGGAAGDLGLTAGEQLMYNNFLHMLPHIMSKSRLNDVIPHLLSRRNELVTMGHRVALELTAGY